MDNIKQFYLMHKNKVFGIVIVNNETGNLIDIDITDISLCPIKTLDKKQLVNWWERRAIPKNQKMSSQLLCGENNTKYMIDNLGLSLVDCYWIKPTSSKFTWEKVNLYTNDFAEKDFLYNDIENATPFLPSATTQGELQKRWIIKDNERYLVKGNYGNSYQQSINEVFATLLHKKQGRTCTEYELINLPTIMGEGIGCISKNFTNENLEFIPAIDVSYMEKKENYFSEYQHFVNVCVNNGLSKEYVYDYFDYMILSDFIMTNIDRHLLNFGIRRDTETLQFIDLSPYFDTGNSMFFNTKYNENNIFDVPITSYYKTELKMLDQVKNKKALDISKLPTLEELENIYKIDPYSVVYIDNIKQGYLKKIEMLNAYQKGFSLNKRSPQFYLNFNNLQKDCLINNEGIER